MPSFQDSAVIFLLALLLFGPKKLPELARYVGKLMGEFRRASSEFRLQMEDEFRISEQAEAQKKLAAIEAAAPSAPVIAETIPDPEHGPTSASETLPEHHIDFRPEPVAIASSGDLDMLPPATGLPVGRAASSATVHHLFDCVPPAQEPASADLESHDRSTHEAPTHESEASSHV